VETLEKIWRFKVEPYGEQKYRPKRDKKGIELQPRAKGRWFERFAGDCEVGKADVDAIVKNIHEHLHDAEYTGEKKRKKGRIAARAVSIADNVWLRPKSEDGTGAKPARPIGISEKMLRAETAVDAGAEPAWTDKDLQIYKQ